ncbi:MAG: DUF5368 family protein [Rubrimonas sp.]|uniref:DUF5368 family protein n=1 Tax=Rubrimonas sp. TaxID=2036015 RepID=UPI002FDC9EAA
METMTVGTLIAVFEEMFGAGLFWGLVAAAAAALALFLFVAIRDGGILGRRFARAELLAPVGGLAAVIFVWVMTSSGLSDMGGPVDLLTVLGIFFAGAAGAVMISYIALGLMRGERR